MTPEEHEKVATITEFTSCTEVDAIKHLRRKNGNLEQAIDAIMSGESADLSVNTNQGDIEALRESVAGVVAPGGVKVTYSHIQY